MPIFFGMSSFLCSVGGFRQSCYCSLLGDDDPFPMGSMYGIFKYIWLICMVNVGKYTSPMDPMGFGPIFSDWNHR